MTSHYPEPLTPPQGFEADESAVSAQHTSASESVQAAPPSRPARRMAQDQELRAADAYDVVLSTVASVDDDELAASVPDSADGQWAPEETLSQVPSAVESAVLDLIKAEVVPALKAFSARADFYENLVRQLQHRIETLQGDQVQELLSPVLQRLAILLTQATDSAARARRHDGDYQADVEFDHFADLVIEALALVNVDSVGAAVGVPFNRTMHAARKAATTDDQSLEGIIAKVLRQGLIRDGAERAFLPAQVTVYRYSAEAAAPTASPEPDLQPERVDQAGPQPSDQPSLN